MQPFSPTILETYSPSKGGNYSGIGHEVFQPGQLKYAQNQCVRFDVSEYQLLDKETKQVISNEKVDGDDCIAFTTS